jgi:secreted trypsin-like serine protease
MDYETENFQVGLVISFEMDNGWCSGTLVSRTFVLSAGSCLVGPEKQVSALLGASDITRVSEFLMVISYIVHPELNEDFENDISLIRLQREAQINSQVQVMRLPNFRQRDAHFQAQKVFVAG